MSALAWISNALRPLKLDELKEALAVRPEDHELDEEAIPEEALIVSVSAGLITIDPESETIRLVHFTVEEYFRGSKHKWFLMLRVGLRRLVLHISHLTCLIVVAALQMKSSKLV